MRENSVAVGSFAIDAFPCGNQEPAIEFQSKGATLEG